MKKITFAAKRRVRKTREPKPELPPQVVDPAIMAGPDGKMPVKQFVEAAIKQLRTPPHKGIHVVYSLFNKTFAEYYGVPARAYTDALIKEGFLEKALVHGGIIINLVNEPPEPEAPPAAPQMSPALSKVLSAT